MNILEEIAAKTKERIEARKRECSLQDIKYMAESLPPVVKKSFREALLEDGISFICEVKKASPSKGIIAPNFPYIQIAKEYEAAGASAISCLTEPFYFQGKNEYLQEIAKTVSIPVLRKDFTVDEYMIYEAKTLNASAILLICSILSKSQLREYHMLAKELSLDVLVEAHDEEEVAMAIEAGADIIGVNNRNLKTFEVDVTNSLRLRKMVPDDIAFVSESGIRTREDIRKLRENGTDAVLIGETFMRCENKAEMLKTLSME